MVCIEPRMVKRSPRPRGRVMACLASGRKSCSDMVGIRRGLVHSGMAGVAVGRSAWVFSSYVAICTGHVYVRARQRKWRSAVVESGPLPFCSRMTETAVLRIASRYMVRICRPVIVGLVARNTGSRQARIDVVRVTLRA
jgi:hypothetical protein